MLIKVILKILYLLQQPLNYCWNILLCMNNGVEYISFPTIKGRVRILNLGIIVFGKNVKINSGRNYNIIGGDIRTNIIVYKDAKFEIGDNVGLSNSTFVCSRSIIIQDDVLIGGGCKFYDTDFHSLDFENRMKPYKYGLVDQGVSSKGILIKQGAWIGGHCIVLKGVTIGRNSILGAGSVLSRDIPDNEVWGGNPASFIRKLEKN